MSQPNTLPNGLPAHVNGVDSSQSSRDSSPSTRMLYPANIPSSQLPPSRPITQLTHNLSSLHVTPSSSPNPHIFSTSTPQYSKSDDGRSLGDSVLSPIVPAGSVDGGKNVPLKPSLSQPRLLGYTSNTPFNVASSQSVDDVRMGYTQKNVVSQSSAGSSNSKESTPDLSPSHQATSERTVSYNRGDTNEPLGFSRPPIMAVCPPRPSSASNQLPNPQKFDQKGNSSPNLYNKKGGESVQNVPSNLFQKPSQNDFFSHSNSSPNVYQKPTAIDNSSQQRQQKLGSNEDLLEDIPLGSKSDENVTTWNQTPWSQPSLSAFSQYQKSSDGAAWQPPNKLPVKPVNPQSVQKQQHSSLTQHMGTLNQLHGNLNQPAFTQQSAMNQPTGVLKQPPLSQQTSHNQQGSMNKPPFTQMGNLSQHPSNQPGSLGQPQQSGMSQPLPNQQGSVFNQHGSLSQQGSLIKPPFTQMGGLSQAPLSQQGSVNQQGSLNQLPLGQQGSFSQAPLAQQGSLNQPPLGQQGSLNQPLLQQGSLSQPPLSQQGSLSKTPLNQQGSLSQPPLSQHGSLNQPPLNTQGSLNQPPLNTQGSLSQQGSLIQPLLNQQGSVNKPPFTQMGSLSQPPLAQQGRFSQLPLNQQGSLSQPPLNQQGSLSQPPLNLQGSLSQPPLNQQGSLSQPPLNQQGSLSQPPLNQQGSISQPPLNQQGSLSQPPLNQHGSLSQPPLNLQGSLSQPPLNLQGSISQPPLNQQGSLSQPPLNQHGSLSQPPLNQQGSLSQPPLNQQGSFSQPPLNQQGSLNQPPFSQQGSLNQPPLKPQSSLIQNPLGQQSSMKQPPLNQHSMSQTQQGQQASMNQPPLTQHGTMSQTPLGQQGSLNQQSNMSQKPLGQQGSMSQTPLGQQASNQPPFNQQGSLGQPPLSQQGILKTTPLSQQGGLKQPPLNFNQQGTAIQQQGHGSLHQQPFGQQGNVNQQPFGQQGNVNQQPFSQQGNVNQPPFGQQGLVRPSFPQQQSLFKQPSSAQKTLGSFPPAQNQPPFPQQNSFQKPTQPFQNKQPFPVQTQLPPTLPTQQQSPANTNGPPNQMYQQPLSAAPAGNININAYQQQQQHSNVHSNRYPNQQFNANTVQQQPQPQQPYQQYGQPVQKQGYNQAYQQNVTQAGFNKLWGAENYDLLQCATILPQTKVETPLVHLGNDILDSANCHPDIFRCTMTKIPETNALLQKSRLPLGVLIHPFKDLNHLSVIQCNTIVRCRACRTYINPFVYFVDSKRWKCNLCYRINELPEEFQYDPVTKTYGDPARRPEVKTSTIEFIAPAEYMLRPPQPAIYLFLLDISRPAIESGYLHTVCSTLSAELANLPGDARTHIGFIAYDSALHFYSLAEGLSQPHEMTVLDIEDIFLPCPDNLLVNLRDHMELVADLLAQLPTRFDSSYDTGSALGAALQAAHKMMASTGGRVTVFQASLPSVGPGALTAREDPSQRASGDVQFLNPANDFYKRLALECSGQQIAVDLFLINSQYIDVATISGISRFSGGCMYHFPLFKVARTLQSETFERSLKRYLTRKIGFEAVMRIRCTRGLSIHTFHGNFFVRSTDLLSLPNVNPDAGFGMQVAIEENLSDIQTVCFQAALLYTSSKGERRIRVHTACLPVANTLTDIINSADQQCIIGLLAKMAVDRSMQSNLSDAREAFINSAVDILSSYKLSQNLGTGMSGLMAPKCLRLLPLYICALLKNLAFRTGVSTRLDDRVKAMCDMKTKPLSYLIQQIYPDLYPIHKLSEHETILNEEGEPVPNPPHLQLSARSIDSNGSYLLDLGEHMIIIVCPAVSPAFLNQVLGVPDYGSITDQLYELPMLDNEHNQRLHAFINYLNDDRPIVATIQILRDNSPLRATFLEKLIEDRVETALSYHEFLQHLKTQVK